MKKKEKKNNKIRKTFVFIILIICLTFIYSRYIGTKGLIIREYKIESEKLSEDFNGFKIVHFSDIHYGTTIFKEELDNTIKTINKLKPDIIVFTGDLIDKDYKINDNEKNDIINILKKLEPKLNTYAVYGNHDQETSYESILSGSNILLLNNENTIIHNGNNTPIMLIGLDDYLEGHLNIEKAFSYEENNYYKILLTHEPDVITKIDNLPDLILAGHSHNGQIRIPFFGAIYKTIGAKKYYDEKYNINNTELYISGGLGTSKLPMRLFNKPSINFYRLYTK